jgi:hypothetical protein
MRRAALLLLLVIAAPPGHAWYMERGVTLHFGTTNSQSFAWYAWRENFEGERPPSFSQLHAIRPCCEHTPNVNTGVWSHNMSGPQGVPPNCYFATRLVTMTFETPWYVYPPTTETVHVRETSEETCFQGPPEPTTPVDDPSPTGGGHNAATEPLILDLEGDGILTSDFYDSPVRFDMNGDGVHDLTAWTAAGADDALLYRDVNRNGSIDGAHELFGDATILPNGSRARTGYQALAAHDDPSRGGNGDGVIAMGDRVWGTLRLWVDRDHDGVETNDESFPLAAAGVVELSLDYITAGAADAFGLDASGNWHLLKGTYRRRINGGSASAIVERAMHDVFFRTRIE